jgi:hypothetical protein
MSEILRARFAMQGITRPARTTPVEIVRRLLAVQSQDYHGAKWAIGLRLQKASESVVDAAVNEPAIVRTHVLRPTWHFVAAEDIRWLLALTGPRVLSGNGSMSRKLGLEPRTMARAHKAVARALEGGKHLTREELSRAIEAAGITPCSGQRLAYVVMHAEQIALICNGPRRGKQFTYALMDERVPKTPIADRDELLGRLATRYFTGHGPATARDLARWATLTQKDVARAIDVAGKTIVRREIMGRVHYAAPNAPPPARGALGAHLLSIFDEYFGGYRDRDGLISAADARSITQRGASVLNGFTVHGVIRGTWSRTFTKSAVDIVVSPLGKLSAADKALVRSAAVPYAAFLGLSASVTFDRG